MKVSIIGCGNIGGTIIKAVEKGVVDCEITGIFDVSRTGFDRLPESLRNELNLDLLFTCDFNRFLKLESELVVEAASQEALRDFGPGVLSSGRSLVVMSVGALVCEELLGKMKKLARENNVKIYIPSGAVVGLDGVSGADAAGISEVSLTTRKSPESLGIEAGCEKTIYEGPAREAVKLFPKNVNVAATISLSGIGFEKTKVKIIADPKVKSNIHEIYVRGKFGEMKTRVENVPSPGNPRTSYLASLSAIALLKKITGDLQIGT